MGESHDLPLRQGKQQLPEHRVRLHLLVRQRPVHAGVEVVVVEIVPQNLAPLAGAAHEHDDGDPDHTEQKHPPKTQELAHLEAGHCGPILPVQVQAHPGDLALLDPQLLQHVLCSILATVVRCITRYTACKKLSLEDDRRLYPVCSCGMLG
jgi:hypothetical protein